jgi:cytidyltransferase-like protein
MKQYARGMVFGVFDGLHPGHEFLLRTAHEQCDELIVVVTPDSVAQSFKQKLPKNNLEERIRSIQKLNADWVVVPGDSTSGEWNIITKYNPDVVFVGHDQQAIGQEMKRIGRATRAVESFQPETYKSSIINKNI